MNSIVCSVAGVQNAAGKTQLKNALDKLEGVCKVGVNVAEGTVEIKYKAPASCEQLKSCIESAGFKILDT
ncbi:MAG: heavy-metal-associated domain-containing protein [Clostridiales bacterium]|jgi:copper chaperone CopZ|nr:heavy-metal-associated domain-containing protein [Clostridiales bacterium]